MKIVKLTAENVKRLKAVEITPEGNLVTITGRNAQGKTSVMDAIWLALGGRSASKETTRPVRDGEDHASVTLDLGDLTVTRTWTGEKTALTVKSADGAKYSSPQTMLDALVGRLSFDPLEFTRLSAREQTEALLELVDLDVDLDELATERKRLYDERTEIGRQGKALGDTSGIDRDMPGEEQSASELIGKIRAAQDQNRAVEAVKDRCSTLEAHIRDLEQQIHAAREELKDATKAAATELIDTAQLEQQLADIEDTNAKIRANNDLKAIHSRTVQLRGQYDDLTAAITALDKTKADALASATFPVDGLGFDEHGVTYQGVPFSQASSAEQIRVSLAMAMALNPKLRVLRILDGSLLDSDSLALITEQAKTADYQVWLERVEDSSATAVVIEDGAIAEVGAP